MPKRRPAGSPTTGLVFVLPWSLMVLAGGVAGCRDSSAGGGLTDAGRDSADTGADTMTSVDADCTSDASSSALCPVTSCGYLKSNAILAMNETPQSGADSLCNQGRVCLATDVTATGDAIALNCHVPRAGGLDYGMPCSTDATSSQRCKDDSLCIAPPGGTASFCTKLCRVDADCGAGSACLEYQRQLPNNSSALVAQCTPVAKIGGTICTSESACPAQQGCIRVGSRTLVRTCQSGGSKNIGDSCTAITQCRSGDCFDRDFRVGSSGTRAFCSGPCARNSDCGADQRCVVKILGNNGTISDPFDDVAVGYCRSLFASPIAAACQNDQACISAGQGGDTCHPTYGICYKAAAVIGGACAHDDGCGLGGACAIGPTFFGGACVLEGCAPTGATGTDVCPGAQSTCSQRAPDEPLYRCYEGCATAGACSRQSDGYFCAAAKDGQPISICLSR